MLALEHIHPIVVHFPIALLTTAVVLTLVNVARGGDLAGRQFLPQAALGLFVLGTLGAGLAVLFGDLALNIAVDKGVPESLAEGHEGWAFTTLIVFGVLTLLVLAARWRGVALAGGRGLALAVAGVVCLGILANTAYLGGQLVYEHGVNIHAAAAQVPSAS